MSRTSYDKPRPSLEFQLLTFLNSRMNLPPHQKKNLTNLKKGYEGEQYFFQLLKDDLSDNCIRLFDLLLESNNTEFQIDNAIIFQNVIYMNEVKNFEGDFLVKEDKWYAVDSSKEVRNPILQLQRSEFLLRQLLQQMGVNFKIKAHIVFVNPSFTLYQAPYDQTLIFPTQLNRYLQKLNNIPSMLTAKHTEFAKKLVDWTIEKSSRERLPKYEYGQLQKGIICLGCGGFMSMFNQVTLQCRRCGRKGSIEEAVVRSVKEFSLMFPNQQITTNIIHDWCNVISSKKTIRKILTKNLIHVGKGRGSHYIL